MAAGAWSFGGFDLNTSPYEVFGGDPNAAPVEISRLPYAAREGSGVSYVRVGEGIFQIDGRVQGATATAREASKDSLLSALMNGRQNLKLGYQDERFWLARLLGPVQVQRQIAPLLPFVYRATFLADDPFAYAIAATAPAADTAALANVAGSLYRKTLTLTPAGSAPSRPRFTITVPAGGPYGLSIITVRNTSVTPNTAITITRTYAANDVLIIDCDLFSVTVNGVAVDYSGQFPLLDPRAGTTNSIQIDGTASSTPTLNVAPAWTSRYYS